MELCKLNSSLRPSSAVQASFLVQVDLHGNSDEEKLTKKCNKALGLQSILLHNTHAGFCLKYLV